MMNTIFRASGRPLPCVSLADTQDLHFCRTRVRPVAVPLTDMRDAGRLSGVNYYFVHHTTLHAINVYTAIHTDNAIFIVQYTT